MVYTVGDLGRLRSRGQCDRDEPRAVGRFLGRSRCRFQSEHEDFCQHGVPPWFALCCFVGGVGLAVQIVGVSERDGPSWALNRLQYRRATEWLMASLRPVVRFAERNVMESLPDLRPRLHPSRLMFATRITLPH